MKDHKWVRRAFLFAAILTFGSTTVSAQGWARLDDLTGSVESCPIRIEIDIGDLLFNQKAKIKKYLGRARCNDAFLSQLKVWHHFTTSKEVASLRLSSTVSLPPGEDKLVKIEYLILQNNHVVRSSTERIKGDEGELSSGVGTMLEVPLHLIDPASLVPVLRIEVNFSDR